MRFLGNLLWLLFGGLASALGWVFGGGAGSVLLNILWLVLTGLPMALAHAAWGCLLCVTVIGIPFGLQFFKLARLSLFPFGSQVRHSFL